MTLHQIKLASFNNNKIFGRGTSLTPVIGRDILQQVSYRFFVAASPVSFCPSLLEYQQLWMMP
jgi:hypothetical protein